ncbi:MAG TPA: hypothetical protein VK066_22745 [Chloroflexota bacterium]|nr:hypothetical protein [Chloroflexota bacterium]
MTTLEIEGAERGWLATVCLGRDDALVVRAAVTPDLEQPLRALLQGLLEQPHEGSILGERHGDDLLHGLAEVMGRRRPLLGTERVFGYVPGAPRTASADRPPGWDEP